MVNHMRNLTSRSGERRLIQSLVHDREVFGDPRTLGRAGNLETPVVLFSIEGAIRAIEDSCAHRL